MKKLLTLVMVLSVLLIGMPGVAVGADGAGVILTPAEVTRLYALADGQQSDGAGGYYGVGVYGEGEWNVLTGPLSSPSAFADDDPIGPPTDGWTLDGISSFAIASSEMMDAGGWSTPDSSDTFELFVNNQATQDPDGAYGPEGWGYSVSYLLITYDTAPSSGYSYGNPMRVTLDVDLGGTLYAGDTYDEYLLDVGYALGTGLTDYNPVRDNAASDPNPGLDQFDGYQSWRSGGYSYVLPTLSDSLEYNGVIGDQVQVLIAVSSFSYSWWGYTWTDATLGATVTAVAEAPPVLVVDIDIKPGSDPNCFNQNGHGVIPVAINGSADFDVGDIKVSSLSFAGLSVRVKGNGAPQCSVQDWNGDTYLDLVCQFVDDAEAWTPGDATATLTGELLDGTPFEGTDSICIVP